MSVVLITGASGAIGGACAEIFAETGYNVIAQYCVNKEKALELSDKLNRKRKYSCEIVEADVSDERSVISMFKSAYEIFPSLDVLVCAAGISFYELTEKTPVEVWDDIFSVNVKGTFLCCKHALPYMKRKNKGKIITLASVWGICGAANEAAYSASKGAVIAFTKALAKEAADFNINVNCVAPGAVYSDMLNNFSSEELELWASKEIPLKRIGSPKEAASAVYFLASDMGDYITGQVISPNGGLII